MSPSPTTRTEFSDGSVAQNLVGFDPFLVELEVDGRCKEVAVLRGVNLAQARGLDLAPICWLLGFFFSGFLVACGCGSVGFDLGRLGFSGSLVGFDDLAADWVGDDLA